MIPKEFEPFKVLLYNPGKPKYFLQSIRSLVFIIELKQKLCDISFLLHSFILAIFRYVYTNNNEDNCAMNCKYYAIPLFFAHSFE